MENYTRFCTLQKTSLNDSRDSAILTFYCKIMMPLSRKHLIYGDLHGQCVDSKRIVGWRSI